MGERGSWAQCKHTALSYHVDSQDHRWGWGHGCSQAVAAAVGCRVLQGARQQQPPDGVVGVEAQLQQAQQTGVGKELRVRAPATQRAGVFTRLPADDSPPVRALPLTRT